MCSVEMPENKIHETAIIHPTDDAIFKKLKIDLTTEPIAFAKKLYVK